VRWNTEPELKELRRLAGEGVHVVGEGPVEHLEEGISDGELLRATEGGVLQDVGDSSGILRDSLEHHPKGVVGIRPVEVQVFGHRLEVGQSHGSQLEILNPGHGIHPVAMNHRSWLVLGAARAGRMTGDCTGEQWKIRFGTSIKGKRERAQTRRCGGEEPAEAGGGGGGGERRESWTKTGEEAEWRNRVALSRRRKHG